MNRIAETFENLKSKRESALVGFVSAGDPSIADSLKIITEMCHNGVDILELGVPFSDPTADGPVIQRSSSRALLNGVNLKTVIEMTREIRNQTEVPIILFSYYNPIYAYGNEAFYRDAVDAGADGVLIVDLPPEESKEMTDTWDGDALSLIRLVAPTTPVERMSQIADAASGFLYLVSMTGVTGSAGLDTELIAHYSRQLRSVSQLPICVGFGISTPQDVADVASIAEGVVIGSAFERLIEEHINQPNEIASIIAERVKEYKQATKI